MKLSFIPKKKVLSLDIGAQKIKFVEGRETKKGILIDNHFSISTPKGAFQDGIIIDKDLIHYVISEALKDNKIKTKNVHVTMNSSKIITREITIPKVEDEEIDNILRFQIEDYIPINIDNYVIQFKVIGSFYENDLEKLNILLIAVPKEFVKDYHELITNLNLNPLVLDYQPNSMAKILKYNGLINETFPTEDITFASIDIGYDNTKISIIKNGTILVSRIVEIGGNYIDQSILNNFNYDKSKLEETIEKLDDINHIYEEDSDYFKIAKIIKDSVSALTEKIEIIFRYYLTRRTDNKINMILISGGVSNLKGLDNMFSNIFNIPSINVVLLDRVSFDGEFSDYINAIGSIIRISEV